MSQKSIKLLPESLINKIAAGEVVERPSSVVKELIENSIDAGCLTVTIVSKSGGTELIEVIDDGSGMDSDDVIMSIERHATSKIAHENDLLGGISSMGFRGEALAAISSVSSFSITTCTGKSSGTYMYVDGGKIRSVKSVPAPKGTKITVRKLFGNVPARKKFLKSTSTELSHILRVVTLEALARPDVQFRFFHNDRSLLRLFHSSQSERVGLILGNATMESLKEISSQFQGLALSGFISTPSDAHKTKKHQYTFINKRPIKSKLINTAIYEAFKNCMAKGRHPSWVLYLTVKPSDVDVNVHPAKEAVRFSEEADIFNFLQKAVEKHLTTADQGHKISLNTHKGSTANTPETKGITSHFAINEVNAKEGTVKSLGCVREAGAYVANNTALPLDKLSGPSGEENKEKCMESPATQLSIDKLENKKEPVNAEKKYIPKEEQSSIAEVVKELKSTENLKEVNSEKVEDAEERHYAWASYEVIGQVFDSFIVVRKDDEMLLIDQHAAHERILYQKAKERWEKTKRHSQGLIVPVDISLTPQDEVMMEKYMEDFLEMGFEIEPFGPRSFLVRAIPPEITDGEAVDVIMGILKALKEEKKLRNTTERRNEMNIRIACHSAIKALYAMSTEEMELLISDLSKCPSPFTCPHGRPTVLRLSEAEIRKHFQRGMR